MKIAITGHRPNKLGNDYDLTSPLIHRIKDRICFELREEATFGTTNPYEGLTLITGMALGIDTLFALIAIENNIPFIAAIPCENQSSRWPEKSRKLWYNIVTNELCTRHYVSQLPYTSICMQKRNEWMVDNCDLLIAVWDGSTGGTFNCIRYAQAQGKEIIYINPKEL